MLEKEIFKPIMVKLPNSEKSIHIACCDKSILVLTKFGKVYSSNISYSNTLSLFTEVSELNDKKIVHVSGTYEHFLALADDGKVYGQGSNNNCKLGLRKDTTGVDEFTQIPSLEICKIKDVYAGKENSLFIGKKGMVLGCGCCANGELFMATGNSYSQIFTPAESLIRKDTTFCIAGYDLSCACVGCEAPPNSPNMPHTTKYPQLIDPDFKPPEKVTSKTSSALNVKPSKTDKRSAESPKLKEHEEKVKSQSKEISSLKEIEKQQENKIKELQSQLKKASSQSAGSLSFDPFEKEEEANENYFIGEDDEANHEVIKRIGEGASAVTYKVFDKKAEKTMCKKVLKIDPNTTFKNAQDAMKEYEILYSIRHPCICRAIAINTTEPADEGMTTIALFLEFLNYGLKDCLDKKMIDNTLKTRIVIEVVHGMKFIHTHGMIHRDLKIENIMLNSVFESKLVDLGLVKIDECVHGANSALQTMTKGI